MEPITVTANLVATNSDVLSGTQLDQSPGAGVFTIYAASTVADSTITISLGGTIIINAQALTLRTNGVPDLLNDLPYGITAPSGVRPVINVIEVTAMTAHLIIVFTPL